MKLLQTLLSALTSLALVACVTDLAHAQPAPAAPPAVGIFEAMNRPVTESSEFLGRIEATNRVSVVARVTAFLDKRMFEEGAEIKKGDALYKLERGPFEADLASKQALVAQLAATLENAKLTTDRQRTLLNGPAGQQSTYDAAISNQRALEAQVQSAQAQVQSSQINLDYTDIRSPIDGKVGRTAVTEGNVVSTSSGVLTTIVSQDPMYVTFPVSVRESLDLRERYATRGGFKAVVIKLQLPDGRMYNQVGQLNFVNNTIAQNTDTITLSRSKSWRFRARRCCRISRAITCLPSAPTTRPSSTAFSWGSPLRPSQPFSRASNSVTRSSSKACSACGRGRWLRRVRQAR
jgi:membrane fusion protein (multidrug efflux system)